MMIALYCITVFTFVYCFALTISEAITKKNDKKRRLGMLLASAICLASAIFTLYTIKDSMTVETKSQEHRAYMGFEKSKNIKKTERRAKK